MQLVPMLETELTTHSPPDAVGDNIVQSICNCPKLRNPINEPSILATQLKIILYKLDAAGL